MSSIVDLALENIKVQGERVKQTLGSDSDQYPHFRDYVNEVMPSYQWGTHHTVMADLLDRIAAGEIKRLMISMPPRHGKSLTTTQLFPSYYLRKFPERKVMVCSYGAELAYKMSREARKYYELSGGIFDKGSKAVKLWATSQGGQFAASGARGPITGSGFNLGIIDDPFKDEKEAASKRVREEVMEWYNSTFYTRKENPEAIILVFTRWHEDDLQGRLIEQEWTRSSPEKWTIVRFEAIKTEDSLLAIPAAEKKAEEYNGLEYLLVPDSCTVVEDDREVGTPLWPEMYDIETLEATMDQLGGEHGYEWLALYQQTPRARTGSFFETGKLEIVDSLPLDGSYRLVRGWDLAGTDEGGDATVGCLMAKEVSSGIHYILNVDLFRFSSGRRDSRILWNAKEDRTRWGHVFHDFEQEPAGSGKTQQAAIVRLLSGFAVSGSVKVLDTETYSTPLRSQIEYGNVKLLRGNWNKDFITEMSAFPKGRNDDQVIAATRAFNKLSEFRSVQIAIINSPTPAAVSQYQSMQHIKTVTK